MLNSAGVMEWWSNAKYQIPSTKSQDVRCPAYALLSYGVASRCQVSELIDLNTEI
jgi:hypothetical protein